MCNNKIFQNDWWAVRENLQNDIGDADFRVRLKDCSSCATYASAASVDQFLKCLGE